METTVRIEGFDEWRKALRNADLAEVTKTTNWKAGDLVATTANRRRTTQATRYESYRKVTVKAGKAQHAATVTVGPKGFGFAAEFGANTHPVFGRRLPQSGFRSRVWPPHSGSGHLVHPALEAERSAVEDTYLAAMGRELRPAFPEGGQA